MKKSVMFVALALVIFSFLPFILADGNSSSGNTAQNGYACLANQASSCSALSSSEQIFTALATGQCVNQVEQGATQQGCWPSPSCDITTTAQAMMALHASGIYSNSSVNWITSQTATPQDIIWYLQIDGQTNATCTISYSGKQYSVNMAQNKQLSSGSSGIGNCFTLANQGYWLQVAPSCYGDNFSVSCNNAFTTTNLYQRSPASSFPAIYVSSSSQSASGGATVSDSVESLCFGKSGSCDYKSSLWASLALASLGIDVSPYLPYLVTHADDPQNQQYLPYSFLYYLTNSNNYLQSLLAEQKSVNSQSYWQVSNDQYFDTALALLPLQNQNSPQVTNAMNWLVGAQDSSGCWNSGSQNSLTDTAFILYSLYGSTAKPVQGLLSCTESGFSCMPGSTCTQGGGNVMSGYSCNGGLSICCSQNVTVSSCAAQGGILCSSDESCSGTLTPSSNSTDGQSCCLAGTCQQPTSTTTACQSAGGLCQSSCYNGQQASVLACNSGQVCCTTAAPSKSSGLVWIIILGVLIVLAVLAIVFRKQLKPIWMRITSKFTQWFKKGGKGPGPMPPRGPPGFPPRGPPGMPPRPPFGPQQMMQRRPMPPQMPPRQNPPRSPAANDVLSKLKEMSK